MATKRTYEYYTFLPFYYYHHHHLGNFIRYYSITGFIVLVYFLPSILHVSLVVIFTSYKFYSRSRNTDILHLFFASPDIFPVNVNFLHFIFARTEKNFSVAIFKNNNITDRTNAARNIHMTFLKANRS